MAFKPMPILDGLVCWLDFRDGNNTDKTTTWIDRSGNGNHGILENFSFTTDAWQSDGFQFKKGASVKIPNLTRNFNSITAQFHAVNVVTGSSGMEVAFHGDYRNDIRKLTTHLTHSTGVFIDSRGISNTVYDRATNSTTTHFANVNCLVTLSTKLGEVKLMRDTTTVLSKTITESTLNLAVTHAIFGNDSNFKSKFLLIYDRPLTDAEILHNINFSKIIEKKDWFSLTMKQRYAKQTFKATEKEIPKPRLKFTAEGYTNYLPLQKFVPPTLPQVPKPYQLSFFHKGNKYNPRQLEWTEFNITSNIKYKKDFSTLFFTEGDWFRTIASVDNQIRKGYIELEENSNYEITFDWKVSSEATHDFITFKTRNSLDTTNDYSSSIFQKAGTDSGTFKYTVTDPTQKYLYFYWRKDGSQSHGTDSGYIKNIKITKI